MLRKGRANLSVDTDLAQKAREAGHLKRFGLLIPLRTVGGECVLRYDNEVGKGDHRHVDGIESAYTFTTPEKLIVDFQSDIERWNDENRDS